MIDLRSDTVTRPTSAMIEAMAQAPVGDDVWGDDPTVNKLESLAAEMTGKASALYLSSGTQSNLVAILSHCQRGEEYIVGQDAHTYKYEGGGAAVLGSVQPQPLALATDGTIPLDSIRNAIKPDDFHFAITRLLCLENTIGGKVIPLDYLQAATDLAREHDLATHLDGARVFNAVVKLEVDVREIVCFFDTVSVCLSKGLGAPVGSVLWGPGEFIARARRWRKMLGGGLRQVGIVAAAGLYALEHNIDRLSDDHRRAIELAAHLNGIENLGNAIAHTNMVFLETSDGTMQKLRAYLQENDVIISGGRLVLHKDISDSDLDRLFGLITAFAHRP